MRKLAFVLSLGAVCVSILSGCKSKSKYKAPTTPLEKVTVALNGVESSFSNYKNSSKTNSSSKTRAAKRINQTDSSGALTEIANLYKSSDSQGDKIDELEFNEPPMIQFQCLKKVLEKIGKSFTFGSKYTDTIQGVAYFDPITGEKKEELLAFKYNYEFTLSLEIDIDDNDLINADVAFKIDLTQGQTTIETNWYVSMVLDYEMSKESPTYTLSMFSDNQESELTYLKYGSTYEYDYVDMNAGRVNEWRKFCYEANEAMVKNETHKKYEDYLSSPTFKAQIGASKWYKNADLRKISHPNSKITKSFVSALFDKFGLNSTEINSQSFISKAGSQSATIKEAYQEFSSVFGQDIIYELITGTEAREEVKSSICVMDSNVENEMSHIVISKDTTLRTLLNGDEGNYGIWYFDKNQEALEQVENLDEVTIRFEIPYGINQSDAVFGNTYLDEDISALYESLGKDNYAARHSNAFLYIIDSVPGETTDIKTLNTVVQVTLGESVVQKIDLFFRSIFPQELVDLGFPLYEGEECLFDLRIGVQMVLDISNTTLNELNVYKAYLDDHNWSKEVKTNQTHFTKLNANKTKLLTINIEESATAIQSGSARIFYLIEDIESVEWPRDEIKTKSNNIFDLVAPAPKNGYFTTVEDMEDTIVLKNFTQNEINAFVETIVNAGAITLGTKINGLNVVRDNQVYHFNFSVSENEITFTYKPDTPYPLYKLNIEKEGEVETTAIPINDKFTSYDLEVTLEAGVYKVKKTNLVNSEEDYMAMEGYDLECYEGKLQYDSDNKTLTVNEEVKVVFAAVASQVNFLTLLDNNNESR